MVAAHRMAATSPHRSPIQVLRPAEKPSANASTSPPNASEHAEPLARAEALAATKKCTPSAVSGGARYTNTDMREALVWREAAVDEHELEGEQQARRRRRRSRCRRARTAQSRDKSPEEQKQSRHDRADAGLRESDTSARDQLDRHLLESPQRGEQRASAQRGRVERAAFLTHRAGFWRNMFMPRGKNSARFAEEEAPPAASSSAPTASTGSRRRPREQRGPFATRAEAEADLLAGGEADSEFDPEPRRCRKPSPSSASPSGSTPTRAVRRRTTSRTSKTTEYRQDNLTAGGALAACAALPAVAQPTPAPRNTTA